MPNTIILYDIPSIIPNTPWSYNTLKARYCLAFKGLPFETVWVECPDIARTCKAIGASPTMTDHEGHPVYTLPVIHDLSTGTVVSDSTNIALYLDKTYPDRPHLFPLDAYASLHEILNVHFQPISISFLRFVLPAIYSVLSPPSQEFVRKFEKDIGMTIEDMLPSEGQRRREWGRVKEEFDEIDRKLPPAGQGPFMLGKEVSFLDFVVAAHVSTTRDLLGDGSDEWIQMSSWNRGRWVNIVEIVEACAIVPGNK